MLDLSKNTQKVKENDPTNRNYRVLIITEEYYIVNFHKCCCFIRRNEDIVQIDNNNPNFNFIY